MARGYSALGGALPGRVNTYFNNPYMGQIAQNLSTAIYGDPRDELVREQIKNQQFNRQRQIEQDELAAANAADKSAALSNYLIALPTFYGEDGRLNPQAVSDYASKNNLGDVFTSSELTDLLPLNADYYRRAGLQDNQSGNTLEEIAARGDQARMTAAEGFGYDMSLLQEGNRFKGEQNHLDRMEGTLGDFLDESVLDRHLYEQLYQAAPDANLLAGINENREAANTPTGRGKGGFELSAGDAKSMEQLLYDTLQTASGQPGGKNGRPFETILEDPTVYADVVQRAQDYYGSAAEGNAATAVKMALADYDIEYTPEYDSYWFDPFNSDIPESMSIRLREGVAPLSDAMGGQVVDRGAPSTDGWSIKPKG